MGGTGYQIADEPRPSRLERLAVHPMWPLFGHMFGGAVLAWPWFVLNGMVVGSPTRLRETIVAIAGFVVSLGLGLTLIVVAEEGRIPVRSVPYFVIGLTVFKLGISYYLFVLQQRTFELYAYFGGRVRNGLLIVIVGAVVMQRILQEQYMLEFLLR